MVRRMTLMGVLVLIVLSFGIVSAESNLKPGKWEITTETEMPGMPMQVPPVTHTQCMTLDDMVPQNSQSGQECQISNINVSGDTVTWTIVCTNQGGTMEGKGEICYKGDQMHGTMEMVMKGQGMRMTSRIKGRRIGNCD